MSRRAAEEMIEKGKVFVNGYRAGLGDRADLDFDEILVDGKKLEKNSELIYVMLNKPKGYVTTMSDEKGRHIVTELISDDISARIYPVGRLDINSEGLLLLTNDGELANRLMHPSGEVVKTYRVRVRGTEISSKLRLLEKPFEIEGKLTRGAEVKLVDEKGDAGVLLVKIKEGKNRQVRRMCENAGLRVTSLERIGEGPLTLGGLKKGCWRHLTKAEVKKLYEL